MTAVKTASDKLRTIQFIRIMRPGL